MLRRGSCIGCFFFARKIRRFLVETANDKRILFFCLLDGVNLQAFYGFYFGLSFLGDVQQPRPVFPLDVYAPEIIFQADTGGIRSPRSPS